MPTMSEYQQCQFYDSMALGKSFIFSFWIYRSNGQYVTITIKKSFFPLMDTEDLIFSLGTRRILYYSSKRAMVFKILATADPEILMLVILVGDAKLYYHVYSCDQDKIE